MARTGEADVGSEPGIGWTVGRFPAGLGLVAVCVGLC